jgi:ornithine carbamoyltransferase
MKQRHLLSLREYSRAELEEIFDLARKVKARPGDYADALKRKALAMVFQKPSTRTRVSFEVRMFQLGGAALFLGADSIHLQRGETVADTAKVLSRYANGIMARVFAHQDVVDLARHGSVPVINGLSDQLTSMGQEAESAAQVSVG